MIPAGAASYIPSHVGFAGDLSRGGGGDRRGSEGGAQGGDRSHPSSPQDGRLPKAMRTPVTVVAAEFEDLVKVGLRQLISEDPNLQLVATDVPLSSVSD